LKKGDLGGFKNQQWEGIFGKRYIFGHLGRRKTPMGLTELLREKRPEILKIAAKHGAYNVRIFGSVARGEADEASDVDILVDAGPETSSWFPAGLIIDLEELMGCEVDVVTEGALHWYIKDQVLQEAVPL
jgi:predicted nucleotidyltransferase